MAPLVGAGAVVVVVVVLLFALVGGPAVLLVGSVVAGFGITYLSGVALNLEERLAFGTVLGAMAVAALSFVLSMAIRDVTVASVLLGLAIALAIGIAAAIVKRDLVASDLSDAVARWGASPRSPGHPWPLGAVVLVCGAWTLHFLGQAYVYKPDGLYATSTSGATGRRTSRSRAHSPTPTTSPRNSRSIRATTSAIRS